MRLWCDNCGVEVMHPRCRQCGGDAEMLVEQIEYYWDLKVPERCQVTYEGIADEFVYGPSLSGWAVMTPAGWDAKGVRTRANERSIYRKQDNGRWLLTEGPAKNVKSER